jgi:hypothetical protein
VRRVLAAVTIFAGAIVIGFNPNRWDPVILTLPRGGHGIHITDLVGIALVTVGVAMLWHLPRRA